MLQNIATHVIAGPLGAGKTTLIGQLMQQRPAPERWAVLINEFGQVGLDAALLATADDGIALGEVAGGCLCCVNGAPFQVGLGRLLRKARPDRLFIEPSGLGHPVQLLQQLQRAPWRGVLDVQPLVMVIDAAALAAGQSLSASQQAALTEAGLMVMTKAAGIGRAQRLRLTALLNPPNSVLWMSAAPLRLVDLPQASHEALAVRTHFFEVPKTVELSTVWADPELPLLQINEQVEGWSAGWRWHPDERFDCHALGIYLQSLQFLRAKGVIRSAGGWLSANVVGQQTIEWRASEWRRDSRLELIFTQAQDPLVLQAGLQRCRLME